ncbi:MAG: hypothetical protein NXI32_04840 [bacterium]|nr:hypothetical protein [bacterium]
MKVIKWRYTIARLLDRVYRKWCWVDLFEWACGERNWQDINPDCRDAEASNQPHCWCRKREHPNPSQLQEPQAEHCSCGVSLKGEVWAGQGRCQMCWEDYCAREWWKRVSPPGDTNLP